MLLLQKPTLLTTYSRYKTVTETDVHPFCLRHFADLTQLKSALGRCTAHYGRTPDLVPKPWDCSSTPQSPGQTPWTEEGQHGYGMSIFQWLLDIHPWDCCKHSWKFNVVLKSPGPALWFSLFHIARSSRSSLLLSCHVFLNTCYNF